MAKEKKYPAEFVARAKAEYPDWPDLHKALDTNNEFVGCYLDDSSSSGIAPEIVSAMIAKGQVQQLREKADQLIRRRKLYSDWHEAAKDMFYAQRMRA